MRKQLLNSASGRDAMELPNLSTPRMSGDLQKRIVSAGILAPIVLFIIFIGGALFNTLIVTVAVIMSFEWQGIITSGHKHITEKSKQRWNAVGILYVTVFASSLIYLRSLENGFGIVMLMLLLVWATDIAAFFTGRMLKGPKICTAISPNKTWSGLVGGMVAAAIVGVVSSVFISTSGAVNMAILGLIIAVVSQVGDFFESWVKRTFGVKDSGSIIPGHGGLMDRLDGFTTVAPLFVFFSLFN